MKKMSTYQVYLNCIIKANSIKLYLVHHKLDILPDEVYFLQAGLREIFLMESHEFLRAELALKVHW